EGRSRFLDGAQHQAGKGRGRGIIEHRHARDGRRYLRQHRQPFAGHRRAVIAEARNVAAGGLWTKPWPRASATFLNTIGVVLVAPRTAAICAVPVTSTSGPNANPSAT